MNDIIKIIKPLQDSGILIDGITTVKYEIKKKETGGFVENLLTPLAASVISLIVKVKVEEELEEQEEDIWIKIASSAPSFKQYCDYYLFQLQA